MNKRVKRLDWLHSIKRSEKTLTFSVHFSFSSKPHHTHTPATRLNYGSNETISISESDSREHTHTCTSREKDGDGVRWEIKVFWYKIVEIVNVIFIVNAELTLCWDAWVDGRVDVSFECISVISKAPLMPFILMLSLFPSSYFWNLFVSWSSSF